MSHGYEAVIGLEVHVQLLTETKMFCRCPNRFGAAPNTLVCPVCLGYPGTLPVMNRQAIDLATRLALALGATSARGRSSRVKTTSIPTFRRATRSASTTGRSPTGGACRSPSRTLGKTVRLERLHLEEDAGKLLHEAPGGGALPGQSLVDFNRCGVPLVEIVSRPDMSSAAEAADYSRPSTRCFSTRRPARQPGGGQHALRRQRLHAAGPAMTPARHQGRGQEPQLLPTWRAPLSTRSAARSGCSNPAGGWPGDPQLRRRYRDDSAPAQQGGGARLPLLPRARPAGARPGPGTDRGPARRAPRAALGEAEPAGLAIRPAGRDASLLASTRELADYFEAAAAGSANPKGDRQLGHGRGAARAEREEGGACRGDPAGTPGRGGLPGRRRDDLEQRRQGGLRRGLGFGEEPEAAVERLGLGQVSDTSQIERWIGEVIESNPAQVAQLHAGKATIIGFLVGQVMKRSGGRADPKLVQEAALRRALAPAS